MEKTTLQNIAPHNLDAEKALIGCFIAAPDYVMSHCADLISGSDFYSDQYRTMWKVLQQMWEDQKTIDITTIPVELDSLGKLTPDESAYLPTDCFTHVGGTATGAKYHAGKIREMARLRAWRTLGYEIIAATESPGAAESVIEQLEAQLARVSDQGASAAETKPIKEVIARRFEYYEELSRNQNPISGLPTGIPGLDMKIRGLREGNMIVIAAQTKGGKTALAMNIATNVALAGHGVGIFSLEMNEGEVADRLISAHSGMNLAKIGTKLNKLEAQKILNGAKEIAATKIFLRDESVLTPTQFRAAARKLVQQEKCKLLILDYAQLVTPTNHKVNREQQVADISRTVKTTAAALKVPIIVMSQLNDDNRSRESRALENDANIFAIIEHLEEPSDPENPKSPVVMNSYINLKYTRDCQSGRVPVVFNREITRFEEKPQTDHH